MLDLMLEIVFETTDVEYYGRVDELLVVWDGIVITLSHTDARCYPEIVDIFPCCVLLSFSAFLVEQGFSSYFNT